MKTKKTSEKGSKRSLLKSLGPGFLLAGAAIGVSHLVQSTRAGADYGFILVWALVLACVTKYPFMEFGPRYAAATGNHLITGYKKLGVFPYWAFIVFTVGTMFIIQAAVTIVTAGLAERLFNFGWSPFTWSLVITIFCISLLLIGKYPGLDKSMKIIVSFLTIATLAAVVMAFGAGTVTKTLETPTPSLWTTASIGFIIAFMGWMPIPLDASVWHSIWTREKAKQTKHRPSIKEAFTDFNIGYLAASLIGLLFLTLGALVMFGSGTSFSSNSVEFSSQLVALYGKTLGSWSTPIISIAAFIALLSTTLTVTDAFPRVISEILNPENKQPKVENKKWKDYKIGIFVIPILSLCILFFLSGSFIFLIDFATGLSFLSAPFLAWFNYKLVTGSHLKKEDQPSPAYRKFSLFCFAVLVIFTLVYLYYILFM
ncbi:Mn2+/Fe2+ NRAMP family transporter [Gillisia mitskevichiae]|uniref:Mn2+/Fe2+ NRAMP family transporter n=1 Tax=Gillisia mitskevichiae TaxID=270921 RepID=A0A495PPQ8_9FLAO|nr:Nramp family divalent metal transporter [Gillisia mitskevichiae]RKS50659.1 Mn2+/Fe2+ NRAMP family transporter [Gillisia mitskevichiae]